MKSVIRTYISKHSLRTTDLKNELDYISDFVERYIEKNRFNQFKSKYNLPNQMIRTLLEDIPYNIDDINFMNNLQKYIEKELMLNALNNVLEDDILESFDINIDDSHQKYNRQVLDYMIGDGEETIEEHYDIINKYYMYLD
jgi:hypothetical protein